MVSTMFGHVRQVAALDQVDHRRDVGEGRRARPEPLEELGPVRPDVVDDLAARLLQPHEGLALGHAAHLRVDRQVVALRHPVDQLVDQPDRLLAPRARARGRGRGSRRRSRRSARSRAGRSRCSPSSRVSSAIPDARAIGPTAPSRRASSPVSTPDALQPMADGRVGPEDPGRRLEVDGRAARAARRSPSAPSRRCRGARRRSG